MLSVTEFLTPNRDILEFVCNENEKGRAHIGNHWIGLAQTGFFRKTHVVIER